MSTHDYLKWLVEIADFSFRASGPVNVLYEFVSRTYSAGSWETRRFNMHQSMQPVVMLKEVLLFFLRAHIQSSSETCKQKAWWEELAKADTVMLHHPGALPQCLTALLLLVLITGARLCSDKAFYSRATLLPAISNLSSISTSSASDLLPLCKSQRSEKCTKTQMKK